MKLYLSLFAGLLLSLVGATYAQAQVVQLVSNDQENKLVTITLEGKQTNMHTIFTGESSEGPLGYNMATTFQGKTIVLNNAFTKSSFSSIGAKGVEEIIDLERRPLAVLGGENVLYLVTSNTSNATMQLEVYSDTYALIRIVPIESSGGFARDLTCSPELCVFGTHLTLSGNHLVMAEVVPGAGRLITFILDSKGMPYRTRYVETDTPDGIYLDDNKQLYVAHSAGNGSVSRYMVRTNPYARRPILRQLDSYITHGGTNSSDIVLVGEDLYTSDPVTGTIKHYIHNDLGAIEYRDELFVGHKIVHLMHKDGLLFGISEHGTLYQFGRTKEGSLVVERSIAGLIGSDARFVR